METLQNWIKEKRDELQKNRLYAQKKNDEALLHKIKGKLDILEEFEEQVINLE